MKEEIKNAKNVVEKTISKQFKRIVSVATKNTSNKISSFTKT